MVRVLTAVVVLVVMSWSLLASGPPGDLLQLARSRRGLPVVVVHAGPLILRLGLDTGTSRTLVSSEAATRLGLRPVQRLSIGSAGGGSRNGYCGAAPVLHLFGIPLVPDCLGWLPDEAQLAGAEDLDGLLGADLLAQVDLWIDAARTPVRARIAPPGVLRSWIDGTRLSVESMGRRPAIAGHVAGLRWNSSSIRLIVDSGANGLVLFGEVARRAAEASAVERMHGFLESVSSRQDVAIVPLTAFHSGGSQFTVPRAGLLPQVVDRTEDGVISLDTFGPVLLDLSNSLIVANARFRRVAATSSQASSRSVARRPPPPARTSESSYHSLRGCTLAIRLARALMDR